jgi:hypothetical protein
MAKKTSELITDTKNDFARLQEELEAAKKTRDDFQRLLDNARRRLKRRENEDRANIYIQETLKSLKKEGQLFVVMQLFLEDAIKKATEDNTEFALTAYLEPLQEVAAQPDIYKLLVLGTGWSTHLSTQIVIEEEAGDLPDWGQAIEDYREFELKTQNLDDENAGERASSWFATHVLEGSLHNKTIAGRLNYTPAKAPYWRILDEGESPLLSDREGGYSVANNTPTGFISIAERAINNWFTKQIAEEKTKVFGESGNIQEVIDEYVAKRDEFSQEVARLKTDMKLNEQIFKSFKDKKDLVDRDALTKLIDTVDANRKTRIYNIAKAGSKEKILVTVIGATGVIEY